MEFLPLDFVQNKEAYTATLYYQAPGKKKEVVSIKEVNLLKPGAITIDMVANSGCVLHLTKKK